jgi:glyoxylase-like metal-dependent hydrolase (beta-lactamase superfamily II)
MKTNILFTCLLVFAGIVSPAQAEPDITVVWLSGRTILLNLEGIDPHNVIALNTKKGIVIIDTEVSPVIASAMRKKIKEIFGHDSILYVINTHAHGDHAFGNQTFADAMLIGHTNSPEAMKGFPDQAKKSAAQIPAVIENLKTRLEKTEPGSANAIRYQDYITYYQYYLDGVTGSFTPPLPDITFNDRMTLFLGNTTLELTWFGNAHSNSDILIYCPEEKFLATGDLFIPGLNPPYLNSDNVGRLDHYISCLEPYFLSDTILKHVIPGHVNGLNPKSTKDILAYLKEEQTRIKGKENCYPVFEQVKTEKGDQAGYERLTEMIKQEDKYFILEGDLVNTGYDYLYTAEDTANAVRMFTLLTVYFPDSWNAWDCLGEALMTAGDTAEAIRSYEKSLELNPDNENAGRNIKKMRKDLK